MRGSQNDEEDSALHVKKIGTYYLRLDPETEEEIYVRKYVSFTVSCIYAPAEQVEIQSNVAGEGN